ncbi:MAG: RNA 2',3'-cyclic phosphodiesterase [Deltaproteobacteria bacterium]|nr:RNA 2',3'-cyclic phosphodiesterase [Deltaproteobacteria bacterium]
MVELVRTFLAVPISEEVKQVIEGLSIRLKAMLPDVRFVKKENLHITLRFLGEIEQDRINELKKALINPVCGFGRFKIFMAQIGAFPHIKRPKIVWIGVKDPDQKLRELYNSVDSALTGLGLPPEERSFTAHLTLGRIKEGRKLNDLDRVLEPYFGRAFGESIVDRVTFFKSELMPDGPIYTPLMEFPFEGRE